MFEVKKYDNAVKYEVLVNYLRDCINSDDYISTKDIKKLLKSFGEKVEEEKKDE